MRRTRAGSPVAWILLGLVAVSALVIGALRAGGASTPEERIDAIASTVKCPVCPGESVYESRNSVALNIQAEIARQVRAGQTDDEIRAGLIGPLRGERAARAPRRRHRRAVWVLPVAVLVAAVAGLVVAFRRWRRRHVGATDRRGPRARRAGPRCAGAGDRRGRAGRPAGSSP